MDKKLKKELKNFIFDNPSLKNGYSVNQILLLFGNYHIHYDSNYGLEELLDELICYKEFSISNPDVSNLDETISYISFAILDFNFQKMQYFIDEILNKFEILFNYLIDESIENDIVFTIYLDTNLSINQIKKMKDLLEKTLSKGILKNNVSFEIKTAKDIVNNSKNNIVHEKYVKSFIFKIDNHKNVLCSPESIDRASIVVNIHASSIHEIYQEKGANNGPLYYSNLRFHIKNKKIDSDLEKAITNNKDEFWFKNNGIVISCNGYEILDNNTIKINNFSFINGGQTTFIIGNYDFDSDNSSLDFFIMAKIIPILDTTFDNEFLERVSIATNKQKPIKEVDLISNSSQIKDIKHNMMNFKPCLYLNAKRGEILSDIKSKNKETENFTLEKIGTLITSFCLQMPGMAKNKKTVMWNEFKDLIFQYAFPNFIYISSYLIWKLNLLLKELSKKQDGKQYLTYYKTGKYFIIALIFFLLKYKSFQKEINEFFFDHTFLNSRNKLFSKDNIANFLDITNEKFNELKLRPISDCDDNIKELIQLIVYDVDSHFINSDYLDKDKSATFANYSKSDDSYYAILYSIKRKIDTQEKEREKYFTILSNIFDS